MSLTGGPGTSVQKSCKSLRVFPEPPVWRWNHPSLLRLITCSETVFVLIGGGNLERPEMPIDFYRIFVIRFQVFLSSLLCQQWCVWWSESIATCLSLTKCVTLTDLAHARTWNWIDITSVVWSYGYSNCGEPGTVLIKPLQIAAFHTLPSRHSSRNCRVTGWFNDGWKWPAEVEQLFRGWPRVFGWTGVSIGNKYNLRQSKFCHTCVARYIFLSCYGF
jgi:hypothetical protein